jgi:hypothetical protein
MPILEFHPDAKKIFEDQVNSLLIFVVSIPNENRKKPSFEPDIYSTFSISGKEIIGDVYEGLQDPDGNEIARYIIKDGKKIGLENEGYTKLDKIAENILKLKDFSSQVSKSFLTNIIFNWIIDKYYNKTSLAITDCIINACNKVVKQHEIWIPISSVSIEEVFNIGSVTLIPITKNIIDNWYETTKSGKPPDMSEEQFKKQFDDKFRPVQGYMAASISVFAEKNKAIDIATKEVEVAIGMLRVLSGANFSPYSISHCKPFGMDKFETLICWGIESLKMVWSTESGIESKRDIRWIIDKKMISFLKESGLNKINSVLSQPKMTEFQEKAIESLLIYSRSSLMTEISDKLIYMLVSLENILLKNDNEAITQNIGERMAFFIKEDDEARKEVIENVRKIYRLRSGFIHHGETIDDIQTMKVFMFNTFTFYLHIIQFLDKFNTKEQFIDVIEKVKLS